MCPAAPSNPTVAHLLVHGVTFAGLHFGSPCVMLALMLLVVLCGLCPAASGTPHSCTLARGVTFAGGTALWQSACSVGTHASRYASGGALWNLSGSAGHIPQLHAWAG